MQYQAVENSEAVDNFSERLTSIDPGKTKKKKCKHKTDDASSLQVNGEVLHQQPEDFKKEKRRKKKHECVRQSDNEISCDGWIAPEIQTEFETKTSSKQKKKRKHQHEREAELSILCNVEQVVEHEMLHGTEIVTKKKKKHKHDKGDEIGILCNVEQVVEHEMLHGTEIVTKKKKKHKHDKGDEIGNGNWLLEPTLTVITENPHVPETSSKPAKKKEKKKKHRREGKNETDTSQATRDDENVRIISFVESTMVEPSQLPSETVLSALKAPFQEEVLVNVLSATNSAVHTTENVSSTPNSTSQDTLISVPLANDSSPLKSSTNFSSTTDFSPSQNAGTNPSVPESPVDLSKKPSGNASLMHGSVIHFSQEHSSDLDHVDDSAVCLSRRSVADVSVISSLDIPLFQEHFVNDSSIVNPVTDSSRAGPSNNFRSANRQLFTEEIPSELSAVSKKSLPKRKALCVKVRCVKTCSIEAPEGSQSSPPAVKKMSHPIKKVRCVKTCSTATREDNSENPEPNQESVKRRSTPHKGTSVERHEKRAKHPDLPKQPVSVYVRFVRDCWKELLEKNPKLKPAQIFIEAANRYRELRDEDKEKYVNEFLLETKEYNVAIQHFLEKHPEHRNRWASTKRFNLEKRKSGSVAIISGQQLYINKRTQEHLAIQADDNIRRVKAVYRKEWKDSLNDQEKVVYILEAKILNAVNAASAESPMTKDSEDSDHAKQITARNYREIEEQFFKENLVPPPANGYQLFIKENANAELPFGEINRHWKKQLSQEERNSYSTRAKLACEIYKKNLAEFEKKEEMEAEFHNLPLPKYLRNSLKEEHKLLVSVRKKASEKPKKYADVKTGRPPINGRRLFFKEEMTYVKELDFKLRFAELNERWKNRLSQEERDEYSARAKAAYDKFLDEHPEHSQDKVHEESEGLDYTTSSSEKTQARKRRLPQKEGEPRRQNKKQH